MSLKRRNTSSPECEDSPKRPRSVPAAEPSFDKIDADVYYDDEVIDISERPQLNAETGQSGAFPGLGSDNVGDLFYGPANDGIDYLRMVRSEAKGIPQLLVAEPHMNHNPSMYYDDDEEDDEGGYWDYDGTYTAKPLEPISIAESKLPPAQLYYYDSLLAQFNVIRATMKCIPPLSAIERLTSSQPISFPSESKKARRMWKECVLQKEPSPVQIACMDNSSVLQLVRLITLNLGTMLESKVLEVVKRFGSWIWAVLGKCPDQGELASEEISELRQLAKEAIAMKKYLGGHQQNTRIPLEQEDASEEESDVAASDLMDDIITAKKRLEAKSVPGADRQSLALAKAVSLESDQLGFGDKLLEDQARAIHLEKTIILDMIVSVIGEVYSQRDLLEAREPWTT